MSFLSHFKVVDIFIDSCTNFKSLESFEIGFTFSKIAFYIGKKMQKDHQNQ